jgi:hypothetical protein
LSALKILILKISVAGKVEKSLASSVIYATILWANKQQLNIQKAPHLYGNGGVK